MKQPSFNISRNGQRAERKLLVTVAEWMATDGTSTTPTAHREILGTRTEDSSIEYNAEVNTTTDIRGNNYTDVDRTQPQQDFDPYLILGGSKLGAFLNDIRSRNALSELDQFKVYIITMFVDGTGGTYQAERHDDCTITYNSIGGDTNVNFPISVYFSNKIVRGTVTKNSAGGIDENFTFTPDLTLYS